MIPQWNREYLEWWFDQHLGYCRRLYHPDEDEVLYVSKQVLLDILLEFLHHNNDFEENKCRDDQIRINQLLSRYNLTRLCSLGIAGNKLKMYCKKKQVMKDVKEILAEFDIEYVYTGEFKI